MVQIITGSILVVLGVYIFIKYPIKSDTKSLALSALFIVLVAILKRLSIMVPLFGTESLKLGFELIPMMLAGMLLAPGYCYMIGIAVDLVGLIVSPTGFPFLGFTLNSVLEAVIPSLIIQRVHVDKQKVIERMIQIGLCVLLLAGAIYIMTLKTVTISKTLVEVTLLYKISIISLACLMIIILFIVMHRLKNKLEEKDLHTFTLWVLTVIVVEMTISFLLTPYWLQVMYHIPFMVSLFIRIIKACIMIPLDICIGYSALRVLKRI